MKAKVPHRQDNGYTDETDSRDDRVQQKTKNKSSHESSHKTK